MARRGTLQGSKALTGGFGIQAGTIKILDDRYKIIQYVKGDGGLVTPMLVWQLDVTKVGENLQVLDENDIVQHDMLLCWGTKEVDGETGLHKFRFHPAKAKSAEDEDPQDLGAEIGTEGNTFCLPEGSEGEAVPFADVDAVLFTKGLEKLGFKPEINNQAYAPNYVGMILQVEMVNPDVLCKKLGVRWNAPKDPAQKPKPQWEILKIVQHPQDAKKAKGAQAGKGASASTSAATGGKGNGAASDFDVAAYVLDRAREVQAEAKGKEMTKAELKQAIYKKALKKSAPPKFHKAIQDYSVSEDGIMQLSAEEVLTPIMDDETITGVTFTA